MIWIHTFGIGKFGRKIITNVHHSAESAEKSRVVLGGTVARFYSEEDVAIENMHKTNALSAEVSDIIDDFSQRDPAYFGTSGWDCKKVRAINMVSQIIEGDY